MKKAIHLILQRFDSLFQQKLKLLAQAEVDARIAELRELMEAGGGEGGGGAASYIGTTGATGTMSASADASHNAGAVVTERLFTEKSAQFLHEIGGNHHAARQTAEVAADNA